MSRYGFDRQYVAVFRRCGVDSGELLRRCGLPDDFFGRQPLALTQEEYFRLMEQLGEMDADGSSTIRACSWPRTI